MSMPIELLGLAAAFFFIALLYSSVGFGGGSSYLAILALVFSGFVVVRSSALLCNLVVVTGSSWWYFKKGHLQFKKFLPFLITSIPLAFIGASFRFKEQVFFGMLGATLIISSIALVWQTLPIKKDIEPRPYPAYMPYLLGAGIGLLSGLVGIGGGIFLAPLLHHLRWNRPLVIAALASIFILVNSVSGIVGLVISGTFELPLPEILFLLTAVLLGGQIGVRLSLGRFSGKTIRLVTALLVLVVGVRVVLVNSFQISFFT